MVIKSMKESMGSPTEIHLEEHLTLTLRSLGIEMLLPLFTYRKDEANSEAITALTGILGNTGMPTEPCRSTQTSLRVK